MEIVSFVNERPLGETNINDEDIPITPNMLATGRPMRQLRTSSTAIMERIDPDKMWLERKRTSIISGISGRLITSLRSALIRSGSVMTQK